MAKAAARPRAGKADPGERRVTTLELAEHARPSSCWLAIDGGVYDVTPFLSNHPGGAKTLLAASGRDASDAFRLFHPEPVRRRLKAFRVGALVADAPAAESDTSSESDDEVANRVEDHVVEDAFRALDVKFERLGYYKTEPMYYIALMGRLAVHLALALALVVHPASSPAVRLAGSALLGLFWQQIAFVGHDCGHNSVLRSRQAERYLGLVVGNLLNGIDIDWWKSTHNVHHVATNSVHYDPDIQHLPVLALNERFLEDNNYSFYHMRFMPFDAASRFLAKYQHLYYFPLKGVARFNLYAQSACHIGMRCYYAFAPRSWGPKARAASPEADKAGHGTRSRAPAPEWSDSTVKKSADAPKPSEPTDAIPYPFVRKQDALMELASFLGYFAWNAAVLSAVPGVGLRVACCLVSRVVAGLLLHTMICASHFSRDMYNGRPCAELKTWAILQLSGTLDWYCSRTLDWFYGGLQFQIEHHLFPRVSRCHLRDVSKHVSAVCGELGLDYHSVSFYEANREVLANLKHCGSCGAH